MTCLVIVLHLFHTYQLVPPSLIDLWQRMPFQHYIFHFIIIIVMVLVFLLCVYICFDMPCTFCVCISILVYIYINKITYFPIWITLCIFGMQLISYNMVCSSILESQGKGLLVKNISNIFLMSCCPSHIQEDLGRGLSRKPCKEGYQRAQAHPSQPS